MLGRRSHRPAHAHCANPGRPTDCGWEMALPARYLSTPARHSHLVNSAFWAPPPGIALRAPPTDGGSPGPFWRIEPGTRAPRPVGKALLDQEWDGNATPATFPTAPWAHAVCRGGRPCTGPGSPGGTPRSRKIPSITQRHVPKGSTSNKRALDRHAKKCNTYAQLAHLPQ